VPDKIGVPLEYFTPAVTSYFRDSRNIKVYAERFALSEMMRYVLWGCCCLFYFLVVALSVALCVLVCVCVVCCLFVFWNVGLVFFFFSPTFPPLTPWFSCD
jgi:hypothetical protein